MNIRGFCEILNAMQDLDVFDICSYLLILNCKFSSSHLLCPTYCFSPPIFCHICLKALLVLHQPETIELWNPEVPIETFWDIRYLLISPCCHNLTPIVLPSKA